MITVPKFPKIFALGHRYTANIFDGRVEITEKVDGSQFSFGKANGELICCSKSTTLNLEKPDNLFKPAVDHVKKIEHLLPNNFFFFGETLMMPKHNVLKYDRVPRNHIALFAVYDMMLGSSSVPWVEYSGLRFWADDLEIDVVPRILFSDVLAWPNDIALKELLNIDSFLGGQKVEGVVFKNYDHDFMIGDQYVPLQCAKYVSERFKETHNKNAYGRRKSKMTWDEYIKSFQTDARWIKAVQHLRERGELLCELKDIGSLIKEVKQDILEEEIDNIKDFLWKTFGEELLRVSTHGLPEWYKQKLATGEIE